MIETAQRLSGCVREVDTVARFGGDEFVVVVGDLDLTRAEAINKASVVAEKVRVSLDRPYRLQVQLEGGGLATIEHHCASSIGIAFFQGGEAGAEEIIKRADAAMYQAKEAGGNRVRYFEG